MLFSHTYSVEQNQGHVCGYYLSRVLTTNAMEKMVAVTTSEWRHGELTVTLACIYTLSRTHRQLFKVLDGE